MPKIICCKSLAFQLGDMIPSFKMLYPIWRRMRTSRMPLHHLKPPIPKRQRWLGLSLCRTKRLAKLFVPMRFSCIEDGAWTINNQNKTSSFILDSKFITKLNIVLILFIAFILVAWIHQGWACGGRNSSGLYALSPFHTLTCHQGQADATKIPWWSWNKWWQCLG